MSEASGNGGALDRLAASAGILPAYVDAGGIRRVTAAQTQRALLAAMGIPAATDAEAAAALSAREARAWQMRLEPLAVFREDAPRLAIALTVPAALARNRLAWTLTLESGEALRGTLVPADLPLIAQRRVGDAAFIRCRFDLPPTHARPGPGYHRLDLEGANAEEAAATTLVVTPPSCYEPTAVTGQGRVWGPAVQLYAVRSRRNWGCGDLSDLSALVEFAAAERADVIALNPLHALAPSEPLRASPYNPSSRLFGNVLYVDPEAIPELATCAPAQQLVKDPAFQARLHNLRSTELVDYAAVFAAKREVLEHLWRHFREQHRGTGDAHDRDFNAFLAAGGISLHRHSLFDAIAEAMHAEGIVHAGNWNNWPVQLRDVNGSAVEAFAAANGERIECQAYLQWQFAAQLGAAGSRAAALGLGIGLMRDLAVGIDPGGSDYWSDPGLYAAGASIGAPPDAYNAAGQNWGLAPPMPERLRAAAYGPFIATLRRNMAAAGALRIDHVMGLLRLFCIPAGDPPESGAYVAFAFDELLGIVALESQRNACLLIGEDLGTVPDEVRVGLRQAGILSSRPLYFATGASGDFVPPGSYPRDAVASVGTHDLPTLRGFWQGADLDARAALSGFGSPGERAPQLQARAEARNQLLHALEREGLSPRNAGSAWSLSLVLEVERFLARTPAKVQLVALEDVFGQVEQVNMPGTDEEYPNWRRKLALDIEDWPRDPSVRLLLAALEEEGRKRAPAAAMPRKRHRVRPDVPRATYRLQLNGNFTFAHATAIVPYLAALGISHVYLSPYFKARPGSLHGYDIVDHNELNPEIGTRSDLDELCAALREHDMGQLLDIVPNHVGVLGADNPWWRDVLENGRAAAHASFFDIDWDRLRDELHGKLLLPVLGDHYGMTLERGDLVLAFEAASGEFHIRYEGHRFPLDPQTYTRILAPAAERLRPRLPAAQGGLADEFDSLAIAFRILPKTSEVAPARVAQRQRDQVQHKRRLADLCSRSGEAVRCIGEEVERLNGRPDDPASFDALDQLLSAQVFRLASWRMAADDINYRRFFDINELAALRMEEPAVFEAAHRLLFDLIASAQVTGVRVDHSDGLYDPAEYFARVQHGAAARLPAEAPAQPIGEAESRTPLYLVTEKITAAFEQLPATWPIAGTTGYDFANLVNGLFVDSGAETKMKRGYFAFVGARVDFDDIVYQSKKRIMDIALASELNALASLLSRIAQADRATCDFTYNSLRAAISEIVACFPVYRTYVAPTEISPDDRRYIEWAVRAARKRALASEASVFDFVGDVLSTRLAQLRPEAERVHIVRFAMRFQQFTGPVFAKGVEDTAFYRYNPLLALNEVGGDPRRFGVSVAAFHHTNAQRARSWPHSMLSTSTHDSKRSEDMRARLDVLSEMPAEWRLHVARWRRLNRSRRSKVDELVAPTPNDEYLLYQTLIGAWPAGSDQPSFAEFGERIRGYLIKVVREAKSVSSWLNPNEAYEAAFVSFARALLTAPGNARFLADFVPFQRRVAWFGMLNSVAQTLLKLTAPGVPDIYQGCEFCSLMLVDPDNRRPVDYTTRRESLQAMQAPAAGEALAALVADLLARLDSGRIKQYVIWRTLELRRRREVLFREGSYVALPATGAHADHVCAYARVHRDDCVVVIVPRLVCTLTGGEAALPVGSGVWGDTSVDLSALPAQSGWLDALTGASLRSTAGSDASLRVAAALAVFPLTLLAATARPDEDLGRVCVTSRG